MKTTALGIAYVVIAFLTFGHVYNSNYVPERDCGARPHSINEYDKYQAWENCRFGQPRPTTPLMAAFPATYAGAAWPLYWVGLAAIAVTAKPSVTMTREETVDEIAKAISELNAIFSGQE